MLLSESRPADAQTPSWSEGSRGAGKSDGAGALRRLCCWKLSYPEQVPECPDSACSCAGSSAGAARREKRSQGVTTCLFLFLPPLPWSPHIPLLFLPPSPFISSSSSIFLSSLPSHKGAQVCPRPLPGQRAGLTSTHQSPGTGMGRLATEVAWGEDGGFQAWERAPRREGRPSHPHRPEPEILAPCRPTPRLCLALSLALAG